MKHYERLEDKRMDGKPLWVTDMPLFHCGSGSSIYNGTAVALPWCCLTLGSKGNGIECAGIHTHTHTQSQADSGARISYVTGGNVWCVKEADDQFILFLCNIWWSFLVGGNKMSPQSLPGF